MMASCKPGPVETAIGKCPQANGLAIIISNDCDGTILEKLTGTHKDGQRMKATFESIGFAAVHKQNLTLNHLQELIHEATQRVRYPESYKSICFVFSGHGGCDTNKKGDIELRYLYDQTARKMKISDILEPFMPKAAPKIGNIPKVFCIDACRGEKEMHKEAVMVPKSGPGADIQSRNGTVHHKGGNEIVHLEVPPESNWLIAYSTTENYQSYEVRHEGGIWLRALSDMIRKKGATESVTNILTEVNAVLKKKYQDPGYRIAMTQPEFRSQLNGTLYLVPQTQSAHAMTASPSRQSSLSQEDGILPKSGENHRSFLNSVCQLGLISKPDYPTPEKSKDGLFFGTVQFTIKASNEPVTFTNRSPENTHKKAWESAAKQASDYLMSKGIGNKSGVVTPSNSNNGSCSSASPKPTKVSTPKPSAAASPTPLPKFNCTDNDPKPPVMQLKEYCEKHGFDYDIVLIKEHEQSFQCKAKITSKECGGKILMEAIGEVKGNKKDAKHSAAKNILDKLH